MGCSRLGLLAVLCVIGAALVTILSLFVPFWSKIALDSEGSSAANAVITEESGSLVYWTAAELTVGIWGSCLSFRGFSSNPHLADDSNDNTATSSEPSPSDEDPQGDPTLVATSFTCASFFTTDVYGASCSRTPGDIDGSCSRSVIQSNASLCDEDPGTVASLMMLPERDQHEQQLFMELLVSDGGETLDNWERFRSNVCRADRSLGITDAVLAMTSLGLVIVSVVELFLAITFAAIELRWIKLGRAIVITAAILQTALLGLWVVQSQLMTSKPIAFGTSFYLSCVGVVLLAFSSFAISKHLRLERVAWHRMEAKHALMKTKFSKDEAQEETANNLEVVVDIHKPALIAAVAPKSPVNRRASGRQRTYVAV